MKLYVCYGTFPTPRPGGHPCANAYHALKDAGHEPEIVKAYGLGMLPEVFNRTAGRQEVKRLTGSLMVPVLITDEGEVVESSERIVAWAKAHPVATPV